MSSTFSTIVITELLDHLLLLGRQRLADRLEEVPAEGAVTRFVAHDEPDDLPRHRIARHVVEMLEHVEGDLLRGADERRDDALERNVSAFSVARRTPCVATEPWNSC